MFASAASQLSRNATSFFSRPACTVPNTRQFSSRHDQFFELTSKVHGDQSFQESAEILRNICKADLVKATDLRDDPEWFWESHRILARHGVNHGPGFMVRFTVHYNLFGGTILAVGNEEQVAELADYQKEGKLGCFALTEHLAGVQSGLVCQTTADWDKTTQEFILNTPNFEARKNWISQGFVAEKALVMADLRVDGESKGPTAFVTDFRKDGELVDGVKIDDMGRKTTGNDLDNAWITFENVRIPKKSMLSKYAEIIDNEYVVKQKGVRPFDMVGQRLYSGRIAVAGAALAYRRQLYDQTKQYSDNKKTFSFKGEPVLSNIPQLKALYEENEKDLSEIEAFATQCELQLNDNLRNDIVPSDKLVDAIATLKVQASERSIDACFRLKQEVGSYALMDSSGFKHMDFLQMCKFAEGDSRILMLKMARDRMKKFMKEGTAGDEKEVELCMKLATGMQQNMADGMDKLQAWDKEYVTVYALAEAIMARVMREGV